MKETINRRITCESPILINLTPLDSVRRKTIISVNQRMKIKETCKRPYVISLILGKPMQVSTNGSKMSLMLLIYIQKVLKTIPNHRFLKQAAASKQICSLLPSSLGSTTQMLMLTKETTNTSRLIVISSLLKEQK